MRTEPTHGSDFRMKISLNGGREGSVRPLGGTLTVGGRLSIRRLKELRPVLYDAFSCTDMDPKLPVYTVYRTLWADDDERNMLLKHGLRYDITDMPPLMLGDEYVKTFGHEHVRYKGAWSHPELFEVFEGEARFLIQRYRGEEIVDVSLVVAREGDVVLAPPGCGHIMINASSTRLLVGNLISRYCLQTYERFTRRKGGAYFLLKERGAVRNENYPRLPELRIVDAEPLAFAKDESGLLASFGRHPELFRFLNNQYDLPE